jgi:hypothetical protein
MFQQSEPTRLTSRIVVSLAIVASLLLGFIAGRFSSGLKPHLGWLDPDVLFVGVVFVILVAGALLSCGRSQKPSQKGC